MAICKVAVLSTGYFGAPGYTTFYLRGPDLDLEPLHDFFDYCKDIFPDSVRFHFPTEGVQIVESTGELSGSWTADEQDDVDGTSTAGFAAASGGLVRWNTGEIINGRRVYGHSFLVPLAGNHFTVGGNIDDEAVTIMRTAAGVLRAAYAGDFVVWHRPKSADDGEALDVTGHFVRSTPSILTTRRQ